MSPVEAPFIIAIIREKEKSLLGDNEITRIMHAKSVSDAREVLLSTPYAMGITNALEHEFLWLKEHLDNKNILAFIAARYDVLHVAQTIIAYATGERHAPMMSQIGTLSHEMLQGLVFLDEHAVPNELRFWVQVIEEQKKAITEGTWTMPFLFDSMQRVLEERLTLLAATPFMKALATHVQSRHASDTVLKKDMTLSDATRYEWEWDMKLLALVRPFRFEPVGYDPIIAYWITKEIECKTIRLIFAALESGFSQTETTSFIRSFAHV